MAISTGGGAEGDPMMDINTTPLIDVMLVLLIMFIITIPIQTHAVKLDLPPPNPNPSQVKPDYNQVNIDFLGTIYWNNKEVTLPQLIQFFKATKQLPTEPELRLRPDPLAKYDLVDRVMAAAQQAGVTKMGFVGNEQYANQ
ncbi:MAG: biopolymer transporter ExbD [Sphingomonadaceae bacterium]|nr:biopolymer transporter ExbD [Sphingomonadaceae bacterium]